MEATGFIQVRDLNLAWISNNNDGPTIFFIHGNSGSARTWHQQFEDPQLARYRLVAIDLPGHGHSSHSSKPDVDYSPIETGRIMTEAVKKLGNDSPYILAGVSYGTNVMAEMLNHGSTPVGVILIGMCCVGEGYGPDKVFLPSDTPSVYLYNEENTHSVKKGLFDALKNENSRDLVAQDYFRTDKNFRPAMMKSIVEGRLTEEIKALEDLGFPVCTLYGDQETIINPTYVTDSELRFWKNQIVTLRDAGHLAHLDAPAEINSLIAEYAAERFTAVRALPQS